MADEKFKIVQAVVGLNLDSIPSQMKEGQLSYALNAQVENFDGNQVTYQNEQANIKCLDIPEGYLVIGIYTIAEDNKTILFLTNNEDSEIGFFVHGECLYTTLFNAKCLNFNTQYPIHDVRHKRNKCGTEIYWTDNHNPRRWLDLSNLPYETIANGCDKIKTNIIDCNKLNIQPDFSIPNIDFVEVTSGGILQAGTYQFAVQYANSRGDGYTSYYSVTNPISIYSDRITQDFNFETDKSISFEINDIDTSGVYTHINIAVIKTINNIASVELIGTYDIRQSSRKFNYTGVNKTDIKLSENDIFERFPFYEKAGGLSRIDNVLVWYDLTTEKRNVFQKIANKIKLNWISYRIPTTDSYKKAINTANLRSYMRDEVYAFEVQFLMRNGKETDGFHIPGRESTAYDREIILNDDVLPISEDHCEEIVGRPRWQVYNTGTNLGFVNNFCKEPVTTGAKITFTCDDNDCSEQGEPQIHFEFPQALSQATKFHIGVVVQQVSLEPNKLVYVGSDIFTPPTNAEPWTYYDNPAAMGHMTPFEIIVPAGVTNYSTPVTGGTPQIFQAGITSSTYTGWGAWICHNCQYPIRDLYIKSVEGPEFEFSSPQQVQVYTVYRPSEPTDPEEPCIEVDECYTGPWEYGEFGYWESQKTYPCNEEIWGELAGQPIRHHRFPDNLVSYHHDDSNIFPIGVSLDRNALNDIIRNSDLTQEEKDNIVGFRILRSNRVNNKTVIAKGLFNNVGKYDKDYKSYYYPNYPFNDLRPDPFLSVRATGDDEGWANDVRLNGFSSEESKQRFVFHSPDTHFYQPTLGTHIKIDSIEYGQTQGHYVEVKEHSKYKFLSQGAHSIAIGVGAAVAISRIMAGLSWQGPDLGLGTATYKILIELFEKILPAKSFTYQFNSLAEYLEHVNVENSGNKIRLSDIMVYLASGMQGVGDIASINNHQRESSVYSRTTKGLLFPHEYGAPIDVSRFRMSEVGTCNNPSAIILGNSSTYYGAVKRSLPDQYGDIYSYETISTGFQFKLDSNTIYTNDARVDIFGGDIFINSFAYKTKFPIFLDHRVGAPDGSDVDYQRLDNVAYPTFWFSTDFTDDGAPGGGLLGFLKPIFGIKVNNFDCERSPVFYQDGKIYLFVYGIAKFFVESEVNVDYRQATNSREGDFYPHVGTGIPDDWFQEINVSIVNDNTYTYNRTFSKQNKEIYVSHVPEDYTEDECVDLFPNRAIYSDPQDSETKNNWLIYRPVSKEDFPYSYGPLKSIESLENKAILVRFKNRSQIYNALLTIQTNSPVGAYLGNDKMFGGAPAIDFADLNIGYNGTQHKLFVRTEFGHLTCDSERGRLFLVQGTKLQDISSGISSFLGENLPFKIKKSFPEIDIDNNFSGIGLTGTYDNVYKRILLTKLDYEPIAGVTHASGKFYFGGKEITLGDSNYFCNKSWTLSYNFTTQSWTSFHSYIPRYYIESSTNFLTGIPGSIWEHNKSITKFNNFYGVVDPYILEYSISYSVGDEIAQSIMDYTTVFKYEDYTSFYQNDDVYFNKCILYNNQQCSGVRNLIIRPKNNLKKYMSYPKYNSDSIDILVSKSDNKYQYNSFWNIAKETNKPLFVKSCGIEDKALNVSNLDYGPRSFKKQPIRSKDLKVRHILDNRDDHKLISHFLIQESQISYK
jgi:hypothetical protein